MDPLNDAQSWEDFQRLVTYAISIDFSPQQVKARLEITTTKNGSATMINRGRQMKVVHTPPLFPNLKIETLTISNPKLTSYHITFITHIPNIISH